MDKQQHNNKLKKTSSNLLLKLLFQPYSSTFADIYVILSILTM